MNNTHDLKKKKETGSSNQLFSLDKITFMKNVPSSLFSGITSFAGSIRMIFFSTLTCTIVSQGGPNKTAAANFLWLHFLNNKSSIQSLFFFWISGLVPTLYVDGDVSAVHALKS